MARNYDRKLVLENGQTFYGYGFGGASSGVCQLVFNTAMAGYQEMISDPSATDLMVVMTYPIIGNYGITDEDFEAKTLTLGGLVVGEYNDNPSNFRYTKTLAEVMAEHHISGIEGIDTRMLTRILRDKGTMKAVIVSLDIGDEEALKTIAQTPEKTDAVARVSCKKRWYARTSNHKYGVVAVDCGIKMNVVRKLNALRCNVTVVPYDTTAEEIAFMEPDGVIISSGPGSAEHIPQVEKTIAALKGSVPMLGIDLGALLMAKASGASIGKMQCGHHGGNRPVKNLKTGKIDITSQGHDYEILEDSLEGTGLTVTFRDVIGGSVEGVADTANQYMAVQFHPESAPGPRDAGYIFDEFVEMMKEDKENA